ncbi:condensin-2 complex subunit G2-like isoform X1 [Scylla paramamosain]|uniref:condensin-2 complex subunit G2-like isoform X1 n=1 Tax=Scylla paramamosain TaxID=85552 RepID=UPI0030831D48
MAMTTTSMTAKQQLLEAVEGHQPAPFLSLIQGHEKKRKTVDLEEVVLELSRGEVKHVWGCLQAWADEQVTAFVAEHHNQNEEIAASGTNNKDQESTNKYNEKLLEGIVKFAHIYISTFKEGTTFIPGKMLEMTLLLHEMLAAFNGSVKLAIVSLCEQWWLQELEAQDLLVTNVLSHLLEATTRNGAQKKEVLRLWKLHNALATIDLDSPNNKKFVELLTYCISCPIFLNCDEGIKWLVGLFSWPSLIPLLHKEVRLAIPECTRAHSAKYGEVYFKAWKASQGDTKKTIEEECIQDLMYTAIHANPMSSRPSANLHHLLHHIHSYKKHRAVSSLITELYQPILWRSFTVANGYVRMNATGLLCDAFPLNDYNLSQEEQSNLLERQYHTLKTLLLDPCHLVRITAVKGVFNILCKYWIMVPNEVIKAIFKTLLTVLVYDVTTAEVRLEVIKGLTLLLGSADAVPFLIQVLPRLGDVFDDANHKVREAFAKLLLKVKESQALKYWDIVSVPHLLHRLELDNPKVAQLVSRLLLSSFHPFTKTDEELLQRSLSLLEENRMAARRFYQYAGSMISLPNVVHFMLLLWLCLSNHIALHRQQQQQQQQQSDDEENEDSEDSGKNDSGRQRKQQSVRGGRRCERDSLVSTSNKENAAGAGGTVSSKTSILSKDFETSKVLAEGDEEKEEEESEDEEVSPLDNLDVLCGILDTVGILWATNAHRLAKPENNKYLEALRNKLSRNFQHFFKYFKGNADASRTLLYIASFLPKSLVPTLVGHCMSQLKAIQVEQVVSGSDTSYKSFVNALCNWKHGDSLLELLSEWLEEGFKSGLITGNKERRRSRRQVRFCETSTPKPQVALHILCHILEHPINRVSTLQRHRAQLLDIIQDLTKVKDLITERLHRNEELSDLCCDTFLCECWSLYLRLVVVCHHSPSKEPPGKQSIGRETEDLIFHSPACVLECLEWASSTLVPYLGEKNGGKRKLQDTEEAFTLITTLLRSLVTSSTHLLIIGAANIPFVYMLNDFVKILIETDSNGMFWEEGLCLAQESYEFLWVYESSEEEKDETIITGSRLANICISSMADYFKHHDQLPQECELSNTLVHLLMSLGQRSRQDQSYVLEHLMSCVVEHLCWRIEKNNGVDKEAKCIQHLGGFVALLVGTFQKQTKLSIVVMDAFSHFLSTANHDMTSLLAACHLLEVLLQDSGKISRYSLKQTVVAANSVMSAVALPEKESEEADQESPLSIYKDSAKTANKILDNLKESLSIV